MVMNYFLIYFANQQVTNFLFWLIASISYAKARVTISAFRPSITALACFPEPPCDCFIVTSCPVLSFQYLEKIYCILRKVLLLDHKIHSKFQLSFFFFCLDIIIKLFANAIFDTRAVANTIFLNFLLFLSFYSLFKINTHKCVIYKRFLNLTYFSFILFLLHMSHIILSFY